MIKYFIPKGVDFYNIQNKKICDLDLTQFNTKKINIQLYKDQL